MVRRNHFITSLYERYAAVYWLELAAPGLKSSYWSLGQFFPNNEMLSFFGLFQEHFDKVSLLLLLLFFFFFAVADASLLNKYKKWLTLIEKYSWRKNSFEHNATFLVAFFLHTWANLHLCKDIYICKVCACELHLKITELFCLCTTFVFVLKRYHWFWKSSLTSIKVERNIPLRNMTDIVISCCTVIGLCRTPKCEHVYRCDKTLKML